MYKKNSVCRSSCFPWLQASSGVLDCPWCINGDHCVVVVAALLMGRLNGANREGIYPAKSSLTSTTSSTVL